MSSTVYMCVKDNTTVVGVYLTEVECDAGLAHFKKEQAEKNLLTNASVPASIVNGYNRYSALDDLNITSEQVTTEIDNVTNYVGVSSGVTW